VQYFDKKSQRSGVDLFRQGEALEIKVAKHIAPN
jgi:hypothetical protein